MTRSTCGGGVVSPARRRWLAASRRDWPRRLAATHARPSRQFEFPAQAAMHYAPRPCSHDVPANRLSGHRRDSAKGLAMYKLLLSGRYLRTRFIALASIISVMLGVATMI